VGAAACVAPPGGGPSATKLPPSAAVAQSADAVPSKGTVLRDVWVRVPPAALALSLQASVEELDRAMTTDPAEQPKVQIGGPETGEAADDLIRGNRAGGPSPIDYMNGLVLRRRTIEENEGATPPARGSGVELFGHTFSYEALIAYGAIALVMIGVIALVIGPGN
jgi:hypothetical protein